MHCLNSASIALLLACSLAVAGVHAQRPQPPESPVETAATAQAPATVRSPATPTRPAARKPIKRRSVQQVIEPTPRIVTEPYRPALTVRPPPAALSDPLPGPVRLNGCDGGGCSDLNGARYNGGVGNSLIGPQGQLCTRGIVNAQCF
jgi:hypothetical protein